MNSGRRCRWQEKSGVAVRREPEASGVKLQIRVSRLVTISMFSTVNVFIEIYVSTLSPGRTTDHPNILNFGGNRKEQVKERESGSAEGGRI